MVLFFTVLLGISIVGLVSLLAIKRWELRTGNMVLAGVRPHVSQVSHRVLVWIERVLPHLITQLARRGVSEGRVLVHRGAAYSLLWAEQGLERVLANLRGVTERPRSSKEASAFLREIAEHKRQLVQDKESGKVQEEVENTGI
ncbi:hypothetical protein K2Q00_00380 [Patescibacteria group bacterium]|nr:hypothetical protein [Patescibacteria group bacterium]